MTFADHLPHHHIDDRKHRGDDGLPFGRHHFEAGAGLLHVGKAPAILGPSWFGMGYVSWVVAAT